jgi:hypothetical protein
MAGHFQMVQVEYEFDPEFVALMVARFGVRGLRAVTIDGELFCRATIKGSPRPLFLPMTWVNLWGVEPEYVEGQIEQALGRRHE